MVVVEFLAAFYGFAILYACVYLGCQRIADWLEQRTAPAEHRGRA